VTFSVTMNSRRKSTTRSEFMADIIKSQKNMKIVSPPVRYKSNVWNSMKSRLNQLGSTVVPAGITTESSSYITLPDSNLRIRWDILMLILVAYYGLAVPLTLAFMDNETSFQQTVDEIAMYLFIVDMALNFNTAYKSKGILVTQRSKIARYYGLSWFPIDLLATVPVDKIYEAISAGGSINLSFNRVLRLLRLFKLFRVFKAARILKRFEDVLKFNPSIMRLVMIFILLLVYFHWIGSFYWLFCDLYNMGGLKNPQADDTTRYTFQRDAGNLWVPPPEVWCPDLTVCNESAYEEFEKFNGYNPLKGITYCFDKGMCPSSLSDQYVYAIFWAVMITFGIGRDIMPVTPAEHVFSIFAIIVGVIVYAVIIGSFTSALSNLELENAERKKKLDGITQYMRQRNVPHALQKRIREYYEYMWSSHQSTNGGEGIMSDLHRTLRLELQISLNKKIIQNVSLFKSIQSSDCVIDMIENFVPKIFIPGEYIVLEGDIGTDMFIIVRGKVQVIRESNGKKTVVCTLGDGEVFGEQALLKRETRNASVRAVTYCDTLTLTKEDFDHVLLSYPEFARSIQNASLFKETGWGRIRAIVNLSKSVGWFGKQVNIRELLLGKHKN